MIGDGVFDDLEQLLLRVGGPDREPMQQLDHQAGEAFESSRNTHRRADLDQDALDGLDVDLELSGLVDRRIEQGEEALVGDIRTRLADVTIHLAHDPNVFIAVEERILLFTAATAAMRRTVRFQAGVRQYDDEAFGAPVVRGDRDVLFSDKLGEFGGRT